MLHLGEGEVWFASTGDELWGITWYPHRADHPDAPELITDSVREGLDGTGGADLVCGRLKDHFERRDPREFIQVLVEREASTGEVEAVQTVFDEAGMPAIVSANIGRYSAHHTDWLVLVQWPLAAFASGLAAKAGADSWDALRRFVGDLYAERRKRGLRRGNLEISSGRQRVHLNDLVPPHAYAALADLDDEGTYHWDATSQTWTKI